MKKCHKCGYVTENDMAKFCHKCGAKYQVKPKTAEPDFDIEQDDAQVVVLSDSASTDSETVITDGEVTEERPTRKTSWNPFRIFFFSGRIGRRPFFLSWYTCLPFIFAILFFSAFFPPVGLLLIFFVWVIYAQGAKRCHDNGHSGWWQIIPFYWLWMTYSNGSPADNEYGLSLRRERMGQESPTKKIVFSTFWLILAAVIAIILPIPLTQIVNEQVADWTGQWYLNGKTRIWITLGICVFDFLIAAIFTRQSVMKKSFLFYFITLLLIFEWTTMTGLMLMPD